MKSKSQYTIKAQSLNAILPTIIIICYIYVTAGARPLGKGKYTRMLQSIQKRYKVYKNATNYENITKAHHLMS